MMRHTTIKIIPVIIINCFISSLSIAQWNALIDVPLCAKPNLQRFSSIVGDNNGGAWVFWRESLTPYDEPSMYMGLQHLDYNGYATLASNGIMFNANYMYTSVNSAFSFTDGTLYYCYTLYAQDGFGHGPDLTFAQKITTDGTMQFAGEGIPVKNYSSYMCRTMNVTPTIDSGFFVLYVSQPKVSGPVTTFLQKVSKDGVRLWGDSGVVVEKDGILTTSPSLFNDDKGGVYITSFDPASLNRKYYLQYVDSSSHLRFPSPGVQVAKFGRFPPFLNSYLVTLAPKTNGFTFYAVGNTDDSLSYDYNIYAQDLDSLGNLVGGSDNLHIVDSMHVDRNNVWLFPSDNGSLIYFFKQAFADYSQLYVRKISNFGQDLWGGTKTVSSIDTSMGIVTFSSSRFGYLVIWDSGYTVSRSIVAQLLDDQGNRSWGNTGVWVGAGNNGTRGAGGGVVDQYGDCIVCWTDVRDSNGLDCDVYCAKIERSGFMPTITKGVRIGKMTSNEIKVYPNPAHTIMKIDLPKGIKAEGITIVDPLGREQSLRKESDGTINVQSLPEGYYYLLVSLPGHTTVTSFVVY